MSSNSANEPNNVSVEQFAQLKNDQKAILERINEIEKKRYAGADYVIGVKNDLNKEANELKKKQKKFERETTENFERLPKKYVLFDKFTQRTQAIEVLLGEISPKEDEKGKYVSAEQFTQLQNDQKKLLERVNELEKQGPTIAMINDQLKQLQNDQKKLFERISEVANFQQQEKYISVEQFEQFQSDQKKAIFERISELEKQMKERVQKQADEETEPLAKKASTSQANDHQFAHLQNNQNLVNCWDDIFCHAQLQIHSLKVVHKATGDRSVFAKRSLLLAVPSSSVRFYFEITIIKMNRTASFGFGLKNTKNLIGTCFAATSAYAYGSKGRFYVDGVKCFVNPEHAFAANDTLGCGILENRKLLFTRNGHCLDSTEYSLSPSANCALLFPFVTLLEPDDEIEANFGPDFIFDLATL